MENDSLLLDLGSIVGTENLGKVSNVTGGSYNAETGILTLATPEGATTVEAGYGFNTGAVVSSNVMEVAIMAAVPDENAPAIVVSSVNVRPGEEVDVTISLQNNPGIIGMTLKFEYDNTAMTLLSMTESGLEGIWQKNSGVTWASSTGDSTYNGVFLTLRFAVNADAAEGDYQVKVLYGEGDICNNDLEDVNFASVPGTVTVKNRIPGDVNGDEKVNTKDFVTLMKLLAGEDIDYVPGSTDINGDGNVNTKDFITLMKYLSGQDIAIY
ncbi:MAG: cohesin domain-containing protein [Candidatus Limivicinus sp.]|nr:cohesin domain-containing protein [Candidatus Limivicinus sp.]